MCQRSVGRWICEQHSAEAAERNLRQTAASAGARTERYPSPTDTVSALETIQMLIFYNLLTHVNTLRSGSGVAASASSGLHSYRSQNERKQCQSNYNVNISHTSYLLCLIFSYLLCLYQRVGTVETINGSFLTL